MARPRVFISSTFFDLRQIREDVERGIRDLGYEPVRHETGAVPYSKDERLEASAYREVELCDVVICVVGGRFGTESKDQPGSSITQAELRRALEHGLQVFVFVEKNVLSEFSTYQLNKENNTVKYKFADDIRVFGFLEEIYALPRNNPVHPFETAADITAFLKEQFAGLFQRLLQDQKRQAEFGTLQEIGTLAKTLRDLVTFLTEEKQKDGDALRQILLINHPVFRDLANAVNVSYRVFFETRTEMETWLAVRGWKPLPSDQWDPDSVGEYINMKGSHYLKLTEQLFDSTGRLLVGTADGWSETTVQMLRVPEESPAEPAQPAPSTRSSRPRT